MLTFSLYPQYVASRRDTVSEYKLNCRVHLCENIVHRGRFGRIHLTEKKREKFYPQQTIQFLALSAVFRVSNINK